MFSSNKEGVGRITSWMYWILGCRKREREKGERGNQRFFYSPQSNIYKYVQDITLRLGISYFMLKRKNNTKTKAKRIKKFYFAAMITIKLTGS